MITVTTNTAAAAAAVCVILSAIVSELKNILKS